MEVNQSDTLDPDFSIRQEIRSRLEKISFLINQLNNSELSCNYTFYPTWRNIDPEETILYINVIPKNAIDVGDSITKRAPEFHLVAEGSKGHVWCPRDDPLSDEPQPNSPAVEMNLRLVAYNGKVARKFDEIINDEVDDALLKSSLLRRFAERKFTLCDGLGKVPRRLQNALFASSSIFAENINDKIVIRSSDCEYAVEKTSSVITSCPKCRRIFHFSDEDDNISIIDDLSDVESIMSVEENVSEKLEILQQKGIVVNPTEPKRKVPKQVETSQTEEHTEGLEDVITLTDDVPSDPPLPHLLVTVTLGTTNETKVVPFDDLKLFRKEASPKRKKHSRNEESDPRRRPSFPNKRPRVDSGDHGDDGNDGDYHYQSDIPDSKSCPVCSEVFNDVTLFMAHIVKCKPPDEYESEEELRVDEREDEVDENGMPRPKKKKKMKKRITFPLTALSCCICGQSFKSEAHFEGHMKAHEDRLNLDVSVTCPVCNESVPNKRHLNPHFKIAHPVDGACCVECLQVMDVESLKGHINKMHQPSGGTEGHLCPDCGKKCQYLSELEIHIAIQHMGMVEEIPAEQELMCHECGKVFNTRKKLKHHLSNTHKSRDHPCQLCSKIFCHKHQLTKHMLTHSEIKPFKCKYCEYQNARKYRVINHCQKVHNIEASDLDIEVMKGGNRPAEFLQNFLPMNN